MVVQHNIPKIEGFFNRHSQAACCLQKTRRGIRSELMVNFFVTQTSNAYDSSWHIVHAQ